MRHGTPGGATAHYRDGGKPCEPCRVARNEYGRLLRKAGPLFLGTHTADRVLELLDVEGPSLLRSLMLRVVGEPLTVRRTVYRMVLRGDITRNPVTLCYSVVSEEG